MPWTFNPFTGNFDKTGTGNNLGNNLVSSTNDILSDTGTLMLGGTGGTNNENLTLDFETNSNEVRLGSSSSANTFSFVDFNLKFADDKQFIFGGGNDAKLTWDTSQAVDNFQLGLEIPRYFSIMDVDHVGNANRSPSGTSTDPVLRVYSSDATNATDYIDMYHDQSNAIIQSGSGRIDINSQANLHLDSANGRYIFLEGGSAGIRFHIDIDGVTDETKFGVQDATGNQLILTNNNNIGSDHDHALTTDPTLFIHSDTDPDTDNTQWVSLAHDTIRSEITSGKGGFSFINDGDTDVVTIDNDGATVIGDGGAGDSYIDWKVNDTVTYVSGIDDSDSDAFIIAGASGFGGVNNILRLTSTEVGLQQELNTIVYEEDMVCYEGNVLYYTT